MVGHNQVIYARTRGLSLRTVFLEDRIAPLVKRDYMDHELALYNGAPAAIFIGDEEPATADVEFLRGLGVNVAADESRGAERWLNWLDRLQSLPVAYVVSIYEGDIFEWRRPAT